jgi:Fe-Mn family superoxide dismutase
LHYALDALEPVLSRRTLSFHYGRHHADYVATLNSLVEGTAFAKLDLLEIMRLAAADPEQQAVFNNAAQAWNHAFFWESMTPLGGGGPRGALATKIRESFGGFDGFRKRFLEAATAQFGSGWVWLVLHQGRLAIVRTSNAENPVVHGMLPLLTCDLWEHAYYLDYQNQRLDYVKAFLDRLVHWNHAEGQLEKSVL